MDAGSIRLIVFGVVFIVVLILIARKVEKNIWEE